MTQVVDAEVGLEAVGGAGQGQFVHTRVVDQQVDRTVPAGRERSHRIQPAQVQFADLGPAGQGGRDRLALGRVAYGQHHPRARRGQGVGHRSPDAAAGTGHDRGLAGQVGQLKVMKSSHENNVGIDYYDVNDNI